MIEKFLRGFYLDGKVRLLTRKGEKDCVWSELTGYTDIL